MKKAEVLERVRGIISTVTNIPVEEIGAQASYVEDLGLDSLSLLEIGVDVDYEFKLGLPEEKMQEIRTVGETVDLVLGFLAGTATWTEVA